MLILLRSKGRPNFHIKKLSLVCFMVTFNFVLTAAEVLEHACPHKVLYMESFSVARLPKTLSSPDLDVGVYG